MIVDCDFDGVSSGTIFYNYVKDVSPNIEIVYLLHEGKAHGLSEHIENIENDSEKYDLIVLPDSSSNDYEYHERLAKMNIPVLVLDHHLADEEISSNAVIINNQLSPKYKNKELTGAGVTFQFCRYFDAKYGHNFASKYMDLAACGIIGDMGSMLEMENRYIVCEGLKHINNKMLWAIA